MNDPVKLISRDNHRVHSLLKDLEMMQPGDERDTLLEAAQVSMDRYLALEDEFLFPLIRSELGNARAKEGETNHQMARAAMEKSRQLAPGSGFGFAVSMLAGGLKHHRRGQEHEVLPALEDALGADAWRELGERLAASIRTGGSGMGTLDPALAN